MFFTTNLFIFALFELVNAESKPITIKLHPDDIVKSFKSIVSSDYIKMLANEFAAKAAQHFIHEMKTKERKIERDYKNLRWKEKHNANTNKRKVQLQTHMSDYLKEDPLRLRSDEDRGEWNNVQPKKSVKQKKSPKPNTKVSEVVEVVVGDTDKPPLLNEEQAMALLDEPSPDGDNLGEQLTDAEVETQTKNIPVIGVMKINGVYYRRLLGMI